MKVAPLAEVKNHDPRFLRVLEEARTRIRAGRYRTRKEFWQELERRRKKKKRIT